MFKNGPTTPSSGPAAPDTGLVMGEDYNRMVVCTLANLKRDTGIEESTVESQTRIVFVCNAGLVTGCSSGDLVSVFSRHGSVQSVAMVPGKSYAFVVVVDYGGCGGGPAA